MFLMRFTERAYTNYTEEDVLRSPNKAVRVTFSNSHFDPAVASRQYNESLDEWEYVEELGFEGMMLNEHHNTPTSLGAAMNLEAAILARITQKPKIVLMGNPLPIHDNPLRLAEELAEIDMISGGRLVSGFVRGGGTETWSTNANPVHNRGAVRGSPRPDNEGVDDPRPVSMGRQALPLPGGEPLPGAVTETPPARMDTRLRQRRDRGMVRRTALSLLLPGHCSRLLRTDAADI